MGIKETEAKLKNCVGVKFIQLNLLTKTDARGCADVITLTLLI